MNHERPKDALTHSGEDRGSVSAARRAKRHLRREDPIVGPSLAGQRRFQLFLGGIQREGDRREKVKRVERWREERWRITAG